MGGGPVFPFSAKANPSSNVPGLVVSEGWPLATFDVRSKKARLPGVVLS
jgi:hypothetical protein